MFKQKIKYSLIEDYIKLLKIDKVLLNCDNYKCLKYYQINEQLKTSYESLFLKYGFLDLSFLVLKKEVASAKLNVDFSLQDVENLQKQIIDCMLYKFKRLKLNEVEIGFLTKRLNVKKC